MKQWLIRLVRLEVVLIFLVILAGSIVRMTGSGMGCPDWPKCFGYLIPPTERSTLEWESGRNFQKGQMIIREDQLWQAKEDFVSAANFAPEHWMVYTKHDYALFDATHTWIEYLNRLLGALAGLPMLALFLLSLFYWQKNWRYSLLSAAGLFMLGFEAWLGKLVVDGNLIPGSITIHMLGALSIVALLLVFRGLLWQDRLKVVYFTRRFRSLLVLSLLLTLMQIILGTQVREQIDDFVKMGLDREIWMEQVNWIFYVHRSFSLLILALNGWLWWQNYQRELRFTELNWVMGLLLVEILVGVILAYFHLPAWAQPFHLLLGSLILAVQWYALIHLLLGPKNKQVVPVQ